MAKLLPEIQDDAFQPQASIELIQRLNISGYTGWQASVSEGPIDMRMADPFGFITKSGSLYLLEPVGRWPDNTYTLRKWEWSPVESRYDICRPYEKGDLNPVVRLRTQNEIKSGKRRPYLGVGSEVMLFREGQPGENRQEVLHATPVSQTVRFSRPKSTNAFRRL